MRTVKTSSTGQNEARIITGAMISGVGVVSGSSTSTVTITGNGSFATLLNNGDRVRISGFSPANLNINDATITYDSVNTPTLFSYVIPISWPVVAITSTNVLVQKILTVSEMEPAVAVNVNTGALCTSEDLPTVTNFYSDTAAHAGTWNEILALSATVFASLTGPTLNGGTAVTAMPLPVGARIKGVFTNITLTSGSILAFKR